MKVAGTACQDNANITYFFKGIYDDICPSTFCSYYVSDIEQLNSSGCALMLQTAHLVTAVVFHSCLDKISSAFYRVRIFAGILEQLLCAE